MIEEFTGFAFVSINPAFSKSVSTGILSAFAMLFRASGAGLSLAPDSILDISALLILVIS